MCDTFVLWSGDFGRHFGAILSFGFSTYAHFEVTVAILPVARQSGDSLPGKVFGPLASHSSMADFTKSVEKVDQFNLFSKIMSGNHESRCRF